MRKLFFTLLLSLMTLTSNAQTIKLGDVNHDGTVSVTDVTALVDIILNGYSPFSVSSEEVTMQIGGTANVTISGGYNIYEVESANPDIVTATLDGLTVTLTAVSLGETTVTVKDVLTYRTIDIPVVINYAPPQVASTELSLIAGKQETVEVTSGSGSYEVQSSDANVATAVLDGSFVVVTAVDGGTATILVTDKNSGLSATITVLVGYFPLTLSASSLELIIGDEETVSITSGNDSFTVVSSNTGVATAKLVGFSVKVTAVGTGTATITVTDRRSGETATIEVTVEDTSYLTCPDSNHPHLIDLGLPSCTKWACCNVGANTPEAWGGHYAWGEMEDKTTYYWSNYNLSEGSQNSCIDLGGDIAHTEYDVATMLWGTVWQMPSNEQFQELLDNCTTEWVTSGDKGLKFTSKNNDGAIFLPAAGCGFTNGLYNVYNHGFYWSSIQDPSDLSQARQLHFDLNGTACENYFRCYGLSVRPVCASLVLSTNTLSPGINDTRTVEITSGCGHYTVESSDEEVAMATVEGNQITVKAIDAGKATITVTDRVSGQTATISVAIIHPAGCTDRHHPHLVDLGLPSGTKWACCNVGASKPEDFGGNYPFGEVSSAPTLVQIRELLDKCSYLWTTLNGVNGGKFTGPSGGSIFLPATGGENRYWSSSTLPNNIYYAYFLYFNSSYADFFYSDPSDRYSVRPVR